MKYNFKNLPDYIKDRFEISQEPIAVGGEQAVFLLDPRDGAKKKVAKIFNAFNPDLETLKKIDKGNKDTTSFLSSIYQIKDFVFPEESFIANLLPDNQPSLVNVQEFLDLKSYPNIFNEEEGDELLILLRENEDLSNDFISFVKETRNTLSKTGLMLDILGKEPNVVIIDSSTGPVLRCIDAHLLYEPNQKIEKESILTDELKRKDVQVLDSTEEQNETLLSKLFYLENLVSQLK